VIGGIDSSNAVVSSVEIYDPTTDTWSPGTSLPQAVWGATAAVAAHKLYVFGGYCPNACDAVWAYNSKKQTWSAKAPMLTPQGSARAVVSNGIVYVIGGNSLSQDRITTVESYNPSTDAWTAEAPLLVGKSELSAGVIGDAIIAADGYTPSGDTGDNESYGIPTNEWTALAADPTPRNGACTGVIGSRLYVSDLYNDSNNAISVNESFDPATNKWISLALAPNTATAMSFAVYQRRLYCIGGGSSATPFAGSVFDYVQIFQP